jgi:hypothetical protein
LVFRRSAQRPQSNLLISRLEQQVQLSHGYLGRIGHPRRRQTRFRQMQRDIVLGLLQPKAGTPEV